VWLDFFHNFSLHLLLIVGKFHNFLHNSAPIAMQTDEEKFPPNEIIDGLLVLRTADVDVLLDDVVAELIVDQLGEI
jgi:hypothetical protein